MSTRPEDSAVPAADPASSIGDVSELILADLDRRQKAKRRHFVPALILMALSAASMLLVAGVRPDLLEQPTWVLAIHAALWATCLVALPAVGVGLWFPSRWQRVGLVLLAVGLTGFTTLGLATDSPMSFSIDHCGAIVIAYGAMLVALGVVSGAFAQRRRAAASYWIAGGVSLTALQTLTFQCPQTGMAHIMWNHVGGAVVLLALAGAVGVWAHRGRAKLDTPAQD